MNRLLKATLKLTNTHARGAQVLSKYRYTTEVKESPPADKCEVPGLSKKIVDVPSGTVGYPEASKEAMYKNPEYFCYHNASYFEAEVEMLKYRLPQPSNKEKK